MFKDNVIIITGASSGIGRELSYQLAGQGALLVLAARNQSRLEEVAAKCREKGAKTLVVKTDVGQESECHNLIARTIAEYGRIDTLINNAGFGLGGKFDEQPNLELFKSVLNVNFLGSVYCTYYALPYLKKSKGRIVGVSSIVGKIGFHESSAYCASKFAMAGFFDSIRTEIAPNGISVTIVYPGLVASEFRERVLSPDGIPIGNSGPKDPPLLTMRADKCASLIIKAAARRKRDLVLSFYGKLGIWLNFFAPSLLDRLIPWVRRQEKHYK